MVKITCYLPWGGRKMIQFETKYKPEEVGYDESRIDTLNKHFEDLMNKKKIISANYCMARDGKIFAHNAVGKLSYCEEDTRPLQPDTIQSIASITKLFTATAIWQLVEEGKLRADQRVGEIIEEFNEKPFNDITVAQLLSHTSGLYPDKGSFENKYFTSPWDFIRHDQGKNWIAAALRCGMRKKPGEEWAYCSFGYVILGEIITRVSKEFAEDYIIEHIIKPCGLKDTGFNLAQREIAERLMLHSEYREQFVQEVLDGTYKEEESFWSKIPETGGGMYSTVYDLCRFGTMLLQGGYVDGIRVIGRKAIEKMTTIATASHIKDFCWGAPGLYREYGYGPDVRWNDASLYSKGTFFHEGAGGCDLVIDPVEKLVAAWHVPYVNDAWCAEALFNTTAVMWSGLK